VADSASGIRSIADLKGKIVSIGDIGSATEINAREILEAYDIKLEDIQVRNLGFGDSAAAIREHKIDAFFCVAGVPTPAITQLSERMNIVLLEIDDSHATKLIRYNRYYSQHIIPSGTYKGQNTDIKTLSLTATLIASWRLSDDVVYHLTKTLFEHKDDIAAFHGTGTELSVSYAQDHSGVTIPFHPGAGRYYSEIGRFPVQPLPMKKPVLEIITHF
jgi:TRAP transporter TAXI family solute receptor